MSYNALAATATALPKRELPPPRHYQRAEGNTLHLTTEENRHFNKPKCHAVANPPKKWYFCKLKDKNMASLFNFGFFGNQPHRVFNYKPRYYDPEEEKRKAMFGDVDGTNEAARKDGTYVPGSSLRGAFRNGNYMKTRSDMRAAHTVITIITLILIVAVLIFMAKFFELL